MLLGGACCSRALPQLIKRTAQVGLRNSRRHLELGRGRGEIGENASCYNRVAVERAYRADRLKGEQWFLIYNDVQGVLRSRFPQLLVLFPVGALLYDQIIEDGSRWRTIKRSFWKYWTWMPFMILPLISLCILFRIRHSCLLRIYQSRNEPKEFVAVAPRLLFGHRQIHFAQGDAVSTLPPPDTAAIITIVKGNLKIKGKGFMTDNELYRGNLYRSSMFNEMPARPPPESL